MKLANYSVHPSQLDEVKFSPGLGGKNRRKTEVNVASAAHHDWRKAMVARTRPVVTIAILLCATRDQLVSSQQICMTGKELCLHHSTVLGVVYAL